MNQRYPRVIRFHLQFLIGIVFLSAIGVSVVFAQQPAGESFKTERGNRSRQD